MIILNDIGHDVYDGAMRLRKYENLTFETNSNLLERPPQSLDDHVPIHTQRESNAKLPVGIFV